MTVKIRIRFYGNMKSVVGVAEDRLEVPADTNVVGLFEILSAKYGENFEQKVMEIRHGRSAVQRHVLFFIADEKIEPDDFELRRVGTPELESEISVLAMVPFTGG